MQAQWLIMKVRLFQILISSYSFYGSTIITISALVPYLFRSFIGVSKNVMAVGFQEAGRWMYTGGEDGTAKIW